ncbi:rod shape-determining protein MreD [Aquifex sp.]
MQFLKAFFLTFLLAVLQASLFIPVFKSLVFSPQIALLFLWVYSKNLGDRSIILISFLLGLFLDALSNTWGAYTTATVLFTYAYVSLKDALIVKDDFYDFFLIIPFFLIMHKLFLFPLVNFKTDIEFSLKKFLLSFFVEFLFILLFYRITREKYEET